MNREQATALAMYLKRAHGVMPTTGLEWDTIKTALPIIEGIANGTLVCAVSLPEEQKPQTA